MALIKREVERPTLSEMKGTGYHSVWINLPRFIRKTAKELKTAQFFVAG